MPGKVRCCHQRLATVEAVEGIGSRNHRRDCCWRAGSGPTASTTDHTWPCRSPCGHGRRRRVLRRNRPAASPCPARASKAPSTERSPRSHMGSFMPEYSQSTTHMRAPSSRKFSQSGSQWQGTSASRVSRQCLAHAFRLRHHGVVAVRQVHILGGENFQIVVDHGEEFEAEGKDPARAVQASAAPRPPRAGEPVRVRKFSGDMVTASGTSAVTITPDLGIGMNDRRAHTGCRRNARRHRLVVAVDVFLRAACPECAAHGARRDRPCWSSRPGARWGRR